MIRTRPTMTLLILEKLGEIYRNNIWRLHGIPKYIIGDRGPQFISQFMAELCKALETTRNLSTAYHPQTDGQTKQNNQGIEAYLHNVINYEQYDWAWWLVVVEFQYNDKIHSIMGYIPFQLVYGWHPWKGDISTSSTVLRMKLMRCQTHNRWVWDT